MLLPVLPYARQLIEDDDIAAVTAVLRSPWLAHGPKVAEFERAFAKAVGAEEAVACSSGTAALQLALAAADVARGQLCVVPAVTFLSTATAPRLAGADVLFADVDAETGLTTSALVQEALARRPVGSVGAMLPVHLGGRLADTAALAEIAHGLGACLIEDAAHALGSVGPDGPAGGCASADFACFSLHPIKTIAAGEGGVVTTNDRARAERMRSLRNHGVTHEAERFVDPELSLGADGRRNPWSYEQQELGFNLRLDEMSAALALSQLGKLARFRARRQALAAAYDTALTPLAPLVRPIATPEGQDPCLHLYQVRIDWAAAGISRADVMRRMADRGVATQVHYIPLHRQPYFRRLYGEQSLPGADAFYAQVLALPLFPAMADEDVGRVVQALAETLRP